MCLKFVLWQRYSCLTNSLQSSYYHLTNLQCHIAAYETINCSHSSQPHLQGQRALNIWWWEVGGSHYRLTTITSSHLPLLISHQMPRSCQWPGYKVWDAGGSEYLQISQITWRFYHLSQLSRVWFRGIETEIKQHKRKSNIKGFFISNLKYLYLYTNLWLHFPINCVSWKSMVIINSFVTNANHIQYHNLLHYCFTLRYLINLEC